MTAAERRFVRKPASHIRAVTGDRATLECVAEGGRPAPRLTWRRLSGEPLHASRHNVILGMSVLFALSLERLCVCCLHGAIYIIIFTSRPAQSTAMPVLFLLSGPKMVFFAL